MPVAQRVISEYQCHQCISGSKAQVRNIHLAGDEAGEQQVTGAALHLRPQ